MSGEQLSMKTQFYPMYWYIQSSLDIILYLIAVEKQKCISAICLYPFEIYRILKWYSCKNIKETMNGIAL